MSELVVHGADVLAGRYPLQVADIVRASIADCPGDEPFHRLLLGLMAWPGRSLADPHNAKWPALVGQTCAAFGGDLRAAARVGAAVEFVVAAADVADDLADGDWPIALASDGRALNASWTLSWLAQACIGPLAAPLGPARTLRIGQILVAGSLDACAGQDLDLALQDAAAASADMALAMARAKAGSLVAMACLAGAAVATGDPAIHDLVCRFGSHIGIVAQLLNDMVDVDPDAERGSDLRRRKKTLPIAFALRCVEEASAPPILRRFRAGEVLGEDEERELVALLRDLGALHYTWLVAEAHRREALALLPELERCAGGDRVHHLCRLVPEVRLRVAGGESAACASADPGGA